MKKIILSVTMIAAMSLGAIHAQDTKKEKETPKTEQASSATEKDTEGCCKEKKDDGCCKEKKTSCCSDEKKK